MGVFTRLVTGGGIAAFFFFSWVIQMLWNGLIAGHLGLLPRLSYLQAAGLWFLFTLLTAWTGIGAGTRLALNWGARGDWKGLGHLFCTRAKSRFTSWIHGEPDVEWQSREDQDQTKLRRKPPEWTSED